MLSNKSVILPLALAPLALLAACGGAAPEGGSDAASPSPAAAAPAAGEGSATPVAAADAAPPAFAVCKACHTVEKGKNGMGPSLFGIVGSKAGDVPDFTFSPALKASGIVWDREKLDTWLQGPMKMVPGTRMVVNVPDAEARKAIIDYLETLK